MSRRAGRTLLLLLLAMPVLAGIGRLVSGGAAEPEEVRAALPLAPPDGPLAVFHLGHSLVGRDMPAMLAQLAPAGHRYDSQLGWGTSLREHWDPDLPIRGFETENDHPRFRPARDAIGSGAYDAIVLTEMVEIRDAIRWHDSDKYIARWAEAAREAATGARIYLYETWHRLDDPEGWLERIDADLSRYWIDRLARPAFDPDQPVRVIPAGQVMAAVVRAVEARGGVGTVTGREDLFARTEDGGVDQIHLNDLGAYLVALTHYAVLYHRSPEGLPHRLRRADGSPADAPDPETARLMQQIVWQVVTENPWTGVTQ